MGARDERAASVGGGEVSDEVLRERDDSETRGKRGWAREIDGWLNWARVRLFKVVSDELAWWCEM